MYLAEGAAARGHRVTVVSTCGPEMEPYPPEMRNGVEVIRFFPRNMYWSFARQNQGKLRRALWHLRDAWNRDAARRFQRILAEGQPDIVHTHVIDGFSATLWQCARANGIPVIHTAHDYHLICPRAFLLSRNWRVCTHPALPCRAYRAWHLRTTAHVDLLVSPSQFLLDIHRGAGMTETQAAVVRNGIPRPALPRPTKASVEPVTNFLLLSRLTPEKGVGTLLDAVRLIPGTVPFKLTIAGRGPLAAVVEAAAQADERIEFKGFVQGDIKHALLSQADYLLIPSLWYENAPVAIVEAAVYDLGVIGSRIGGIPELVQEGTTGFLFTPGDAGMLASIMYQVASGNIRLEGFAEAAASVVNRHDVAGMVENYFHHYRVLLGRKAPRHPVNCASMPRMAEQAE
jgi:glycosyltransferase involved in cell wall biosynthesis